MSRFKNQSGMASIMVTMIMMVVISLIVLGFAQVSRHEQQQATDRQLSSQAFFAAESAVNDARRVVLSKMAAGDDIQEKNDCAPNADYPDSPTIDATNEVSYTCLLVTSRVDTLVSSVGALGTSAKLPVESATNPIDTIRINFRADNTPSSVGGCDTNVNAGFSTAAAWNCPYGVLRLELVPTDVLNTGWLEANQRVMFLYPISGGSGIPSSVMTNGAVAPMRCTAAGGCNIDISGIGGTKFAAKISAVYAGGTFTLSAKDAAGAGLQLQNAQVMIDATGKARDVLRRVQVRLPLQPSASTPDYAIESASAICKRMQYTPTAFEIPDITQMDQLNPTCRPLVVNPPPPAQCPVQGDIIVVLDTSNSMTNDYIQVSPNITRFAQAKTSIDRLLRGLQIGRTNNVGVLGFSGIDRRPSTPGAPVDNRITFSVDITTNEGPLRSAISGATDEYGTLFIPMLNRAASELNQGAARPRLPTPGGANKFIVIFSDGEANEETDTQIMAVANPIKAAGTKIYTVSVGSETNRSIDFATLRRIASPAKYFDGDDVSDLNSIVTQILSELTCQTPIANP